MSSPETDRLSNSHTRRPTGSGDAASAAAGPVGCSLHVSVRCGADSDVVVLVGELDIATVPQLRSTIDGLLLGGRNRIVVDLDAVTFFDAAAIDAVITATTAVALSGGSLQVTHNPGFLRLLAFTVETHRVNVAAALDSAGVVPRAPGLVMIDPSDSASDGAASARGTVGTGALLAEGGSDAALPSLLRQSASGDEEAFAAVYDATVARAYGLGMRILRDADQAAEVVQEAYVYLWRHSARFQSADGSAISWILTVVHRCAVRRVPSMAARLAPAESRFEAVSGSPDRAAVELAYFEGYTHTEVEKVSGLPVGTAHVRIRAGLLELRDRRRCG